MLQGHRVAVAFACSLLHFRGAPAQFEGCNNGAVADIGNGRCDAALNVPSCGFDGGDCCPCTCFDGPIYFCSDSDFDCAYPDCGDPTPDTFDETTCKESWLGDGYCDADNNQVGCSWDGGDCCECSCTNGPDYDCGHSDYICLDPACSFDPVVIAEYPGCTGDWALIDDGTCAAENNNAACGYDGGDCCLCSCGGVGCSSFDCLDPDAGDEVFDCEAPPPAALPCSPEVQQAWVVETPAQARALAAAVNCSGGSFKVEWRGSVVVDDPIYVVNGTVLAVSGHTNAVVDGNAATRLFTVVDAVLHLNSVVVTSGSSIVGGAIAAIGSSLTLNQTEFMGNRATGFGGAVFASDGSNVSCIGGGTFTDNQAGIDGGAMFVTGSSIVSCGASWVNNTAGSAGGAIRVGEDSSVSWRDESTFSYNTAAEHGGALSATKGSNVSWNAPTSFFFNTAGVGGGAVHVSFYSSLSWIATTLFSSNSASGSGGAMVLALSSTAAWSGVTSYENNTAGGGGFGGALYLTNLSTASWIASTKFLGNTAGADAGAVFVSHKSRLSWSGEITTEFIENSATHSGGGIAANLDSRVFMTGSPTSTFLGNNAKSGGAIALYEGSQVAFIGTTEFTSNKAVEDGGAMYVTMHSTATWSGTMRFTENRASVRGGAVHAWGSGVSWSAASTLFYNNSAQHGAGLFAAAMSEVSWTETTEFVENYAAASSGNGYGGGVCATLGSLVSWSSETSFVGNRASFGGGAFVADSSELSWSGSTRFVTNTAVVSAGALVAFNGSSISWTGTTGFTSNTATADGGAVGSFATDSVNNAMSVLAMNGSTTFSNNSCGANGGALALLGGMSIRIGAVDVSFVNNTAGVAGGAVFVSGTGFGPVFPDVSFVSNFAEVGGAVSTVGSGNLKESADIVPPNPITYERCQFIDNWAAATGGAIESAAGQDSFLNSVFEGNHAGTGGALRLAGTAAIENCSFVDNVSGDEGGAAVSNIGSLIKMEDISFIGNKFDCEPGTFLDYNATGDPFDAACDGCLTVCDGCSFGEPPLVPMCTDAMPHTSSAGGTVTLEMLPIDPGYWRATKSSTDVLPCYHADACLGGITGAAGYCLEGYEGPYCSICSDGYTSEPGFTCSKCSNSAGGIVLAVVLAVVSLIMAAAVTSFLVSGKTRTMRQGMIERLGRYIPLQSVKIVVVAWQILTQFTSVANVTYPDVYQRFLSGLEVFSFDLSWVLSAGCVLDIDFHDRLLMATIGPIIALLFLAVTYLTVARINRGTPDILQPIWNKHVSMVLLLTFVVYSSVSSVLFMSFACEDLDDGKYYLRADYRIECDSAKHRAFQVYAGLMVLVYPVGIPVFYGVLLFRDRKVLRHDQSDREETARISSVSDLWKPYKPSAFYYELVECGRRILLAGVVVFIYPNTAAQIAISLMMAFIFVVVSEGIAPFSSRWDTWLNRMGHAVVYLSMYLALLLKVDVAGERNRSQHIFEALLVVAHACLILVVVVETMVLACALRVESRDEPSARFRTAE